MSLPWKNTHCFAIDISNWNFLKIMIYGRFALNRTMKIIIHCLIWWLWAAQGILKKRHVHAASSFVIQGCLQEKQCTSGAFRYITRIYFRYMFKSYVASNDEVCDTTKRYAYSVFQDYYSNNGYTTGAQSWARETKDMFVSLSGMYRQTSNIRRTLVDNKLVGRSDVVGASRDKCKTIGESFKFYDLVGLIWDICICEFARVNVRYFGLYFMFDGCRHSLDTTTPIKWMWYGGKWRSVQ